MMNVNIQASQWYLGYLEGLLERDRAWASHWYNRLLIRLGVKGPRDTNTLQCPVCFHRRPKILGAQPDFATTLMTSVVCSLCNSKGRIRDLTIRGDGIITLIETL